MFLGSLAKTKSWPNFYFIFQKILMFALGAKITPDLRTTRQVSLSLSPPPIFFFFETLSRNRNIISLKKITEFDHNYFSDRRMQPSSLLCLCLSLSLISLVSVSVSHSHSRPPLLSVSACRCRESGIFLIYYISSFSASGFAVYGVCTCVVSAQRTGTGIQIQATGLYLQSSCSISYIYSYIALN